MKRSLTRDNASKVATKLMEVALNVNHSPLKNLLEKPHLALGSCAPEGTI